LVKTDHALNVSAALDRLSRCLRAARERDTVSPMFIEKLFSVCFGYAGGGRANTAESSHALGGAVLRRDPLLLVLQVVQHRLNRDWQ